MAVHLKMSKGRKKTFMKLPLSFLECFLPTVNGEYLKIYLYGLKSCLENKSLSDSEIAKELRVFPYDVRNAWEFWNDNGVINLLDDGSVEFISPDELDFSEKDIAKQKEKQISGKFDKMFEQVEKSPEFRKMIATVEAMYPQLFSSDDSKTLFDIVEVEKIPFELFLITVAHCVKNKKNGIKYIRKVLVDTYEKGYKTAEAMEHYYASLDEMGQAYGRIKKSLKIYAREFSDLEKEFIDSWLGAGKSESDIKQAYEKTVINTGKISFPYMDKILMSESDESGNKNINETSLKAGPLNNFRQEMPDFKSIEDVLWENQKNL